MMFFNVSVKEKHTKEVEEIYKEILEKVPEGCKKTPFLQKLFFLCDKWRGEYNLFGDCDGARFVSKILEFEIKNPLTIAIIANDLDDFKKQEGKSITSDRPAFYWLSFACICGAATIADYLIKTYAQECEKGLGDFELIISYAIASNDYSFAIHIANLAIDAGQTNRGPIYFYGGEENINTVREIKAMFIDAFQKPNVQQYSS